MKLSTSLVKVLLGISLLVAVAGARPASAQTSASERSSSFVSVNIGAQPKARNSTVSEAFPLYDETATVETLIGIGGKPIFDIGGGYRAWRDFSVGVTFSFYRDSSSTAAVASIPDPLFFDSPQASSLPLDVIDHSERAVHLSLIYVLPSEVMDKVLPFDVMEKLEVAVLAGPSFFTLNKELPGAATVTPGGTTLSSVAIDKFSGSATGGHVGVDLSYMVTPMFGAGVFLRAGSASVSVPNVEGGKVDVGGLNFGIGGRFRF
jgi:hypothetical protein